MAVIVTLLALCIVAAGGYFLLKQFRVIPKIRARLIDRTPYEDIVITEQNAAAQNRGNSVQESHSDARQRIEEGNATIASMSQELASRGGRKAPQPMARAIVGRVENDFGETTSQST